MLRANENTHTCVNTRHICCIISRCLPILSSMLLWHTLNTRPLDKTQLFDKIITISNKLIPPLKEPPIFRKSFVFLRVPCDWSLKFDMILVFYACRNFCNSFFSHFSQVANLYHDYSIGNAVNIIVSRIVLLTEDQVCTSTKHLILWYEVSLW